MSESNLFFENPSALSFLILPVFAVFFLFLRWKKCRQTLNSLSGAHIGRVVFFRAFFSVLSWVCLIIALAAPFWGWNLVPEKRMGESVAIVFDISRSMLCKDEYNPLEIDTTEPITRLEAQKIWGKSLLDSLEGVLCSGIIAKGRSSVAVPMCYDRTVFGTLLSYLSPDLSGAAGTDLGQALEVALTSFSENSGNKKYIVFITDGGDLSESLASSLGKINDSVTVIFVGVGGFVPAVVPGTDGNPLRDFSSGNPAGEVIKTVLEENQLKEYARLCNGMYVRLNSSGSVKDVSEKIKSSPKGEIIYTYSPKSRRNLFLVFSLIFLILSKMNFVNGIFVSRNSERQKKNPGCEA